MIQNSGRFNLFAVNFSLNRGSWNQTWGGGGWWRALQIMLGVRWRHPIEEFKDRPHAINCVFRLVVTQLAQVESTI